MAAETPDFRRSRVPLSIDEVTEASGGERFARSGGCTSSPLVRAANHAVAAQGAIDEELSGYSSMDFNYDRGSALLELAGEIVSAYVSKNSVPAAETPSLIANVHTALRGLEDVVSAQSATPVETFEKPTPAQIKKPITPDALISFIKDRTHMPLKRHLAAHGLDPKGYRARYELPKDYPTVAATYAAQRSALAKAIGLGLPGAMAEDGKPKERGRKTG